MSNAIRDPLSRLSSRERREFLKVAGIVLSAPLFPPLLRAAFKDSVLRTSVADEPPAPTFFLEINLRDQWDFGHVMVPPGLATYADLKRGSTGYRTALFYEPGELSQHPGNVYLTADSRALAPHLDTVALVEICELSMGVIHGHEAANALRSPGRSYTGGAGRSPMWLLDPHAKRDGNENHYGSTPTPAVLHNHFIGSILPKRRNGIAFKGVSRAIHTVYHFSASLESAQLDRFQAKDDLVRAFEEGGEDPTFSPIFRKHSSLLFRILNDLDRRYLDENGYAREAMRDQEQALESVRQVMSGATPFQPVPLALTDVERAYWSEGVPEQQGEIIKANIWEQAAYVAKLFSTGVIHSAALEFDYVDVHDSRTERQMRIMGKQTALPLARLIETFKKAGIYDRTLIAIYSTDGGRSPAANSYGSEGKCGVLLAGGMIRGGYWGDVRVAGDRPTTKPENEGHVFSYHMPDRETGVPVSEGRTNNEGRLRGAEIWRTVAKAAGVPDSLADSFPETQGVKPLQFLLRK